MRDLLCLGGVHGSNCEYLRPLGALHSRDDFIYRNPSDTQYSPFNFLVHVSFRSFCELGAISKTAHSACLPHKSLRLCDASRLNLTKMPPKISIIGVGLVGRGWAI